MSERDTLPVYYTALFIAVENAIGAIEQMNFGEAKEILIRGQQVAEDLYIELKRPVSEEEKRQMDEATERALRRFRKAIGSLRGSGGEQK